MSTVFSFEQSGERTQSPVLGDSYSFSVEAYFMFVENGINSRSVTFLLDGAIIPYQTVTVYRTPTMDGNVYAGTQDGATKNLVSQTTLSISFELPALDGDTTTSNALDYLLEGEQRTHILTLAVDKKIKTYLVTKGETKLIGDTIKNAGQSLTFMESPEIYDLLEFSDSVYIYEASEEVPDGTTFVIGPNTQYVVLGGKVVKGNTDKDTLLNINLQSGDVVVCTAELPEQSHEYLTKV